MTLEQYRDMCEMGDIDFSSNLVAEGKKEREKLLRYSTKHLLDNYRNFRFCFEGRIQSLEAIREDVETALKYMGITEDDSRTKKVIAETIWGKACDELISRHAQNLVLLNEFRVAVEMLMHVPKNGPRYHKLIKTYYVDGPNISVAEAILFLDVAESTFYKQKNEAIDELSKNIWGMSEEARKRIIRQST